MTKQPNRTKTLYKLTDFKGRTRSAKSSNILGTYWGENVTHQAAGSKTQRLCTNGFIHAYESPAIALLCNAHHASYFPPMLWEARGKVALRDGFSKVGCRRLTTIRHLPVPFSNSRVNQQRHLVDAALSLLPPRPKNRLNVQREYPAIMSGSWQLPSLVGCIRSHMPESWSLLALKEVYANASVTPEFLDDFIKYFVLSPDRDIYVGLMNLLHSKDPVKEAMKWQCSTTM